MARVAINYMQMVFVLILFALIIAIADFLMKKISLEGYDYRFSIVLIQSFSVLVPILFFFWGDIGKLTNVSKSYISYSILAGLIFGVLSIGIMELYRVSNIPVSILIPGFKSLGFVFLLLLSWIFLKESLNRQQFLGIILIFVGFFLVSVRKSY